MSKMGWVAHLAEKGDKDELVDYLMSDCYFKDHRQAEMAADNFLDAQQQLEEEGIWKKKKEDIDNCPPGYYVPLEREDKEPVVNAPIYIDDSIVPKINNIDKGGNNEQRKQ
jgi:hypothetical protein